MFKKAFQGMTILFVAAMLLTACAPATATQAPAAPANTVAPAAPAVTSAPAATQGAAPAAGTNWCSGVKIVFFPGGTAGGGFEKVVYNGAVQAAKDMLHR